MSNGARRSWSWTTSLGLHVAGVAIAIYAAPRRVAVARSAETVEFELVPTVAGAMTPLTDDPTRPHAAIELPPLSPDHLGGAHNAQNIDTHERGEHGDGRSIDRGQLLAERSEGVNLSPLLMNTLHVDQENRMDTSPMRRSPQFRRSTPEPGYDPWVSLHDGVLLLRAPAARTIPAEGAVVPTGVAAIEGRADTPPGALADEPGAVHDQTLGGSLRPSAGVMHANGTEHRAAGPTATGHAAILAGHASTTSDLGATRPSDDVDAEALATTLLRNSVASTIHAGPTRADGIGGVGGGGAAGSGGGNDSGGRAHAFGEGDGWVSLSSPDDRYFRYFQDVRRHLDPLWEHAFPQSDALQLRQGTVILRFVIQSDGSVHDVVVQRRSGIDAFDHNVASAVSGAHLPPIPAALQRNELHVTAPFIFRNPIVR